MVVDGINLTILDFHSYFSLKVVEGRFRFPASDSRWMILHFRLDFLLVVVNGSSEEFALDDYPIFDHISDFRIDDGVGSLLKG